MEQKGFSQALRHAAASRRFDCVMAYHCAPVMAGLKPANLVAIRREDWQGIEHGLVRSARALGERQIFFKRLAGCEKRVLLLVYRRDLLTAHLALPQSRCILERCGYPVSMSLSERLARLTQRIGQADAFPHEVGLFLGYPPKDVEGFIQNNGKNYSLCGNWKVYGDPQEAKQLFSAFEDARCHYCARVFRGEEIHNITLGGLAS